jgi:hypothetical protein
MMTARKVIDPDDEPTQKALARSCPSCHSIFINNEKACPDSWHLEK